MKQKIWGFFFTCTVFLTPPQLVINDSSLKIDTWPLHSVWNKLGHLSLTTSQVPCLQWCPEKFVFSQNYSILEVSPLLRLGPRPQMSLRLLFRVLMQRHVFQHASVLLLVNSFNEPFSYFFYAKFSHIHPTWSNDQSWSAQYMYRR